MFSIPRPRTAVYLVLLLGAACSARQPVGFPPVGFPPVDLGSSVTAAYAAGHRALIRGSHAQAVRAYEKSLAGFARLTEAQRTQLRSASSVHQKQLERELKIAQSLAKTQPVATGETAIREDFRKSALNGFYPYRRGRPTDSRIPLEKDIDTWPLAQNDSKDDVDLAGLQGLQDLEDLMPQEILALIADGAFSFRVQETTDIPPSEEYVAATLAHSAQVRFADDMVTLEEYTAGLPFPLLDPDESQAGLKAAWNMRYRESSDRLEQWSDVIVLNADQEIVDGYASYHARACGQYRARRRYNRPQWKPPGVVCKEYAHVAHSPRMNGAAPTHRKKRRSSRIVRFWYEDAARPARQWTVSKRRRRVKTTVYDPQAPSIGKTSILEDEDRWAGMLASAEWNLIGVQLALVPGLVNKPHVEFGGRDSGYPTDAWELRHVYVLEMVPLSPNHPYGRKLFYIDQQTFVPFYVIIFDPDDYHWRTIFYNYGNPEFLPTIKEVRIPTLLGQSWIDYQIRRTTLSLVSDVFYNDGLSMSVFSLNGKGRGKGQKSKVKGQN
jgi:hypothetical protein